MSKIAEKWQITPVKTALIDNNHSLELAHNQDKTNWYVTFEGDFYTEFTFNNRPDAEKMYKASLNSKVYMDVAAKKGGEKVVSPDDIDYELATRQTRHAFDDNEMSDTVISAKKVGDK